MKKDATPTLLDRFRGALVGLAAGDAVGTTVEFEDRGTFEPLTDMIGGGPFELESGQWTDDTSMALCLATGLVECGGFDAADQMTPCGSSRARARARPTGRPSASTPASSSRPSCTALSGATKDEILSPVPLENPSDGMRAIADMAFTDKHVDDIVGSGYVVRSLEAALWCFARHDTFESAVLAAANLGDDADTTAAICGQLAGAHHGLGGIPDHWVERVAMRGSIVALADALAR